MPDMLVKLYELPLLEAALQAQQVQGIVVRRALAPEKARVVGWVRERFGQPWADETDCAFGHQPLGCFVAVHEQTVLGFACYDATVKNFFGPTGVDDLARGKGTGAALLLAALWAMRWDGYAYAIIGGVGPAEFYAKVCGAVLIDGSSPGIYSGLLRALP